MRGCPRSQRELPAPLVYAGSVVPRAARQEKIHHRGTEITEKGRTARFARHTPKLRVLRASVVNLRALPVPPAGAPYAAGVRRERSARARHT